MATSTSIFAVLTAIAQAITAVFKFLLARHNTKNDKKLIKEKDVKKAKTKIPDVCDNGTMSDLIDATLDIKRIKSK